MSMMRSLLSGRLTRICIFAFGIILLISACSQTIKEDPEGDYSFITQKPCGPPCWYGLEPGKSNGEEILEVLNNLIFIDHESIRSYPGYSLYGDNNAIIQSWDCSHPSIQGCGGTKIAHGLLKQIWLMINNNIDLNRVVAIYGEPDKLLVLPGPAEVQGCEVSLYWVKFGMTVISVHIDNDKVCNSYWKSGYVSDDILASSVTYNDPQDLETEVNSNTLVLPWLGFTEQ